MGHFVVQRAGSIRVRRLVPPWMKARTKIAYFVLFVSVLCLAVGLGLASLGLRVSALVACVLALLLVGVAVVLVAPVRSYRRRYRWSLVLDKTGIRTWTGGHISPQEQFLSWEGCFGAVVTSMRSTEGLPVLVVGFHSSAHLARPQDPPDRLLAILPSPRAVSIIHQVLAWLRREHADLEVEITDLGRAMGIDAG